MVRWSLESEDQILSKSRSTGKDDETAVATPDRHTESRSRRLREALVTARIECSGPGTLMLVFELDGCPSGEPPTGAASDSPQVGLGVMDDP